MRTGDEGGLGAGTIAKARRRERSYGTARPPTDSVAEGAGSPTAPVATRLTRGAPTRTDPVVLRRYRMTTPRSKS
jgi:hypothetical protein